MLFLLFTYLSAAFCVKISSSKARGGVGCVSVSLSAQKTAFRSACGAASTNSSGWHGERVTDACLNMLLCTISPQFGLQLLLY